MKGEKDRRASSYRAGSCSNNRRPPKSVLANPRRSRSKTQQRVLQTQVTRFLTPQNFVRIQMCATSKSYRYTRRVRCPRQVTAKKAHGWHPLVAPGQAWPPHRWQPSDTRCWCLVPLRPTDLVKHTLSARGSAAVMVLPSSLQQCPALSPRSGDSPGPDAAVADVACLPDVWTVACGFRHGSTSPSGGLRRLLWLGPPVGLGSLLLRPRRVRQLLRQIGRLLQRLLVQQVRHQPVHWPDFIR